MGAPDARLRRVGRALLAGSGAAFALAALVAIVLAGIEAAAHLVAFGIAVAAITVVALAGLFCIRRGRRLPARMVLELDCTRLPPEGAPAPLARLAGRASTLTLQESVAALTEAASDRRVAGVLVRAATERGGLAQIQELRDALRALQAAGRHTVALADSFGELSGGNAGYYLATACAHIALQPGGGVGLTGIAREANFVVHALERIGVRAVFEGRYEYKSAANRLIADRLTEPDREQEQRMVDAHLDQIVRGIAEGRHKSAAEVRALVDRGPFLSAEALDNGLVDALAHRDEAIAEMRRQLGAEVRLVPLARFARERRRRSGQRGATTVAFVTATGNIARHAAPLPLPVPGGAPLDASQLAATIRAAAADRHIRAVVLRIDSPGGSAVASETIHRAIVRARASGTPVVASMGNVAASGGYYIAAAADRIVAQPGTLTGSIGVVAGKFVVGEAKEHLGVTTDEVHGGRHALITSANRTFDESEHERFAASLDAIYELFCARVAEGRSMSAAAVHELARGRVWTGEDAAGIGLVDTLGGIPAALAEVRAVLGLPAAAPLRLLPYPRRRGLGALARTRPATDPDALVAGLFRVLRRFGAPEVLEAPGDLGGGALR